MPLSCCLASSTVGARLRYQYNTTHYAVLRTTNFNCAPFRPCRGETCRLFPSPARFVKAPLFCFHPINSLSSANTVYVHMKNKKENNSFFCGGKRGTELSWVDSLRQYSSVILLPFALYILVPLLFIINTSLKLCYICLMHTFVLYLYEWTFLRKCTVISSCPPEQKCDQDEHLNLLFKPERIKLPIRYIVVLINTTVLLVSGGLQGGEDQVVFKSSSNFSAFHHFLTEEVVNIVIKIRKLY